jgi:c-di-GMP-binding flagellar brake protein YcgR
MTQETNFGIEDLSPFQIHSRREIVALLRKLGERKQLVRMLVNGGVDAVVTSILDVDDAGGSVIIDSAPGALLNQRILESDNISFETVFEHIRILFFAESAETCDFEGLPALAIPLPPFVIRLQRREYYRVSTPIATPVRCTIQIPREDTAGRVEKVIVPLQNVSGGGIAIIDEKMALDNTVGKIYKDCEIALPGGTLVVASLQIRNSRDVKLTSGKVSRRIGCLFLDLPKPMLAAVQRYITKLERDANAKEQGMR